MNVRTPAAQVTDQWAVETITDDGSLVAVAAEWDDLFARCPATTPFQSFAWIASWWRTYGRPGRLRLVLVRHGDRLVAAAPFHLERRGAARVLSPLGGAVSDFADVLIDEDEQAEAANVLAGALLARRDWDVIDLRETHPGSVAGRDLRAAWRGPHWELPASLCLELPSSPMEDLVRALPTHTRKTVRRRLNQLDKVGVEVREVDAADADRAVGDLLRLHHRQWRGRGVNAEHLRPRFAAFLTGAVGRMVATGQATIFEYRVDGELVASSLVVVGPDLAGGYLYGADPGLRDKVDVITMLLRDTLPLAYRRGCSTMSMLRGAEAYKMRWRPREAVNRRLLFARPGSVRALAYAGAVRSGRYAIRTAKQRLPWLKAARDRARDAVGKLRSRP